VYCRGGSNFNGSLVITTPSQGDFDANAANTLVIGAERTLKRGKSWKLDLAGDLQYFRLNASVLHNGGAADSGAFAAFYHSYQVWNAGGTLRISPQPPVGGIWPVGPFAGFSNQTSVTVKQDFELNTLVLSLGLDASVQQNRLQAGFTANVFLAQSHRREAATWRDPGQATISGYSRSSSDSSRQLRLGHYLAVEARLQLTTQWAMAARYRYDWVNGDVGTEHTSIDFDGASATISAIYNF